MQPKTTDQGFMGKPPGITVRPLKRSFALLGSHNNLTREHTD